MLNSPDTFGFTEGDSKISRYMWKGPEKDIGGDKKKGGRRYGGHRRVNGTANTVSRVALVTKSIDRSYSFPLRAPVHHVPAKFFHQLNIIEVGQFTCLTRVFFKLKRVLVDQCNGQFLQKINVY